MKISVCMATYKGSKHIHTQLSSILVQLSESDEVIVVDDDSSDDTTKIISAFNDSRVKLHKNECNKGVVPTFEKAIRLATGELIFLSDQDDIWFDNKVDIIKNLFYAQDVDMIIHDAIVVRDDIIISNSLFNSRNSAKGVVKNIISNTYTGCCMAFKSSLLKKILPIPVKSEILHDQWIGILADYYKYNILFYSEPLIRFIRHDNNSSTLKRRKLSTILIERSVFVIAFIERILYNKFRKQIG